MDTTKLIGKIKGKIKIAQKLLKCKIPIDDMLELTGLTQEEIEKLNTQ